MDISKDLSYHEDSLGTAEFAQMLQTMKENVTLELEESTQHSEYLPEQKSPSSVSLSQENIDISQSPLDPSETSATKQLSENDSEALNELLSADSSTNPVNLCHDNPILVSDSQPLSETKPTSDEQNNSPTDDLFVGINNETQLQKMTINLLC